MSDHAHFRMTSMADPYHRELSTRERDALHAHGADCPACKQYHDRLLQFEERLELALRVQISHRAAPMTGPKRVGLWRNGKPMLALAASLLLGLVIVSGSWIATTHSSLAADVVSHVAAESVTATSVPSEELHQALAVAGASLSPSAGLVSYASRCSFHGQPVPHLVLQLPQGPVNLMVLSRESVSHSIQMDEHGFRVVIVPIEGHGSLAVLTHAENLTFQDLYEAVKRVQGALRFDTRFATT
jgi:hypothetical protein